MNSRLNNARCGIMLPAGWQTWWETIERGAQKVSDKIVELAEIKPGDKVLDIATGIGEPAVTAARRVKPNGKVLAIDISPQMLLIAKTRAKLLGLDGVMEFRENDGESIDFPDSTAKFDAILSRWGLMFFPNLSATLVKIREMLVTNGRLSQLYGLLHQRFHGLIWLLLQ